MLWAVLMYTSLHSTHTYPPGGLVPSTLIIKNPSFVRPSSQTDSLPSSPVVQPSAGRLWINKTPGKLSHARDNTQICAVPTLRARKQKRITTHAQHRVRSNRAGAAALVDYDEKALMRFETAFARLICNICITLEWFDWYRSLWLRHVKMTFSPVTGES